MWQPIETAPKDGTVIILSQLFDNFAPNSISGKWADGDWRTHFPEDLWRLHLWEFNSATHWIPLPKPPKDAP